MAFDFQAYRNPYVSTIADLLSRGEDAKAKALVDVANAQARAAEARGQAFGGAIENVGKIASTAITAYNSPQARQQRELDRGQAILKARGQEQQPNDRQRVALGEVIPARTDVEYRQRPVDDGMSRPFGNIQFGANRGPNVATSESFALGVPSSDGSTIENVSSPSPAGNATVQRGLARTDAFGLNPQPDTQDNRMSQLLQGSLGTSEVRNVAASRMPSRVETVTGPTVGRYTTPEGMYDVPKAYDDLIRAGISQQVATALAGQGQQANAIFDVFDKQKQAYGKSQVAVHGAIANLALQLADAQPGLPLEEALQSVIGPAGKRVDPKDIDALGVAMFGKSEAEKRQILESLVKQSDAQGPLTVIGRDQVGYGASGNPVIQGPRTPIPERSAALQTLAIAQADFARGLQDGSIPRGTNFTDWNKKVSASDGSYTINGQRFSADGTKIGPLVPSQTVRTPRDPVVAALAQERLDVILAGKDDQAKLAALPPDIRTAFIASVSSKSPEQRKLMLKDLVSQEDPVRQLQYMRNVALKSLDAPIRSAIDGRLTALRQIDDIQETLAALRQAKDGKPIPEGLIGYNVEKVKNFFGKTGNPEYKSLVAKLVSTLQAYRQSMTGKAFSSKESDEYKQFGIAPENLYRDVSWTDASIRGFKDSLRNQVVSQFGNALGQDYDYAEILVGRDKQKTAVDDFFSGAGR
jgi:hypothetical protein